MRHTLRAIDGEDETIVELEMIVGVDDDLAGEATWVANRLHGLLARIHPSLERVLGPRLQHPAVLMLLERFGPPTQIREGGRRRLVTLLRPKAPRMAERLVEEIFGALDEQVGDGSTFAAAGHLAAYAGLAPATRSSGSSIRSEQPSMRGNEQLKRAFFLGVFAALGDPASRAYYDKEIAQGKHRTQALLCLARRRADVLFAMLRDGTFYESRPAAAR
ncbi:hypothetical protein GCM10023336_59120 [Streptomyces similanensis]|uniref:Transposase IS116/IS110/IS902 C-terminal domain-containing protein n=1 Tax=Streptomyces similanensis TaxID=1274988 RepID=A0ABP9L7G8_9ACTN